MKKMLVDQLREGMAVNEFFVVIECERKMTKDNKPFLSLVLGDVSGRIPAVAWDGVERLAATMTPGAVVRVDGAVSSYRGGLQLRIADARAVRANDRIDPSDFVPKTPHDIAALFRQILECKNSIVHKDIRAVVDALFNDAEFSDAFKQHPAARTMHHAYVGGLLEHTLSVAQACDRMAAHYPFVQRDLLVAGAIIHDIGKLKEMAAGLTTEYTVTGHLIGHLVIGSEWIGRIAAKLDDVPNEIVWQLQHMILSHHGKLEFGSPVLPQTLEALVLHMMDMLDGYLFQARAAIMSDTDEHTEFTKKIFGLERSMYKSAWALANGAVTPAPLRRAMPVDLDLPTPPAQETFL